MPGLVYFHGASATVDPGPSDELCREFGLRLFRYVRPGYVGLPAAPELSLSEVAASALDEALAQGFDQVVVVGWSGGGPYALAAGALGRPEVVGVGLLASWAPMNPPASGLPRAVRFFMRAAQGLPRSVLRGALYVVGVRTAGNADDVYRVARSWGFDITDVASAYEVRVWHAPGDAEVPIAPWISRRDVAVIEQPGSDHATSQETWRQVMAWALGQSA